MVGYEDKFDLSYILFPLFVLTVTILHQLEESEPMVGLGWEGHKKTHPSDQAVAHGGQIFFFFFLPTLSSVQKILYLHIAYIVITAD